jgi:hypothetical protein
MLSVPSNPTPDALRQQLEGFVRYRVECLTEKVGRDLTKDYRPQAPALPTRPAVASLDGAWALTWHAPTIRPAAASAARSSADACGANHPEWMMALCGLVCSVPRSARARAAAI